MYLYFPNGVAYGAWHPRKVSRNGKLLQLNKWMSPLEPFKDDIVIRLRSNADGTLVDLRSVSRVGVSDLGANASRIQAFQSAFTNNGDAR